jgi:GTP-binding protein Era
MKAGFVAVVGRPNAGKSSLLNFLVGEKLAMVSKKAQATRKRMNVIVMHDNAQIIFVDTPGLHEKEKLLNQYMMEEALKAIGDADLILYLAPVTDSTKDYERFLEKIAKKGTPHLLILTKADQVSNAQLLQKISEYQKFQDRFLALIPFSISRGGDPRGLLDEIAKHLSEHPWLYDPEILTTENIREIYRELIREAIFEKLSDEIPYESDVLIDRIEESEDLDKVYATIITEKETQKRMIIGNRGESIRRVGSLARKLMERFSGKKIYLDLHVVVRKGWSKNRKALEEIGYIF